MSTAKLRGFGFGENPNSITSGPHQHNGNAADEPSGPRLRRSTVSFNLKQLEGGTNSGNSLGARVTNAMNPSPAPKTNYPTQPKQYSSPHSAQMSNGIMGNNNFYSSNSGVAQNSFYGDSANGKSLGGNAYYNSNNTNYNKYNNNLSSSTGETNLYSYPSMASSLYGINGSFGSSYNTGSFCSPSDTDRSGGGGLGTGGAGNSTNNITSMYGGGSSFGSMYGGGGSANGSLPSSSSFYDTTNSNTTSMYGGGNTLSSMYGGAGSSSSRNTSMYGGGGDSSSNPYSSADGNLASTSSFYMPAEAETASAGHATYAQGLVSRQPAPPPKLYGAPSFYGSGGVTGGSAPWVSQRRATTGSLPPLPSGRGNSSSGGGGGGSSSYVHGSVSSSPNLSRASYPVNSRQANSNTYHHLPRGGVALPSVAGNYGGGGGRGAASYQPYANHYYRY